MSRIIKIMLIIVCVAVSLTAGFLVGFFVEKNAKEPVCEEEEKIEITIRPLRVSEGVLKDNDGNTIALKGMSTHGLAWYPQYMNASAIKTLKEYGANVIRLAMYSDAYEGYLQEEESNYNYLRMGIENALAMDMFAIVDWHILEDSNPNDNKEKAIDFFEKISSLYGNNPGVIYEICNEPNGDTTWKDVVEYANEVIPIIRKNAPDSIIIVGTPRHSTDIESAMEQPLPYHNIMYTYHKYVDISGKEELDVYWLDVAVEKQFPVFVSEWGMAYGEESFYLDKEDIDLDKQWKEADLSYAKEFLEFLNKNNISWCGWSLSNSEEIHSAVNTYSEKISNWSKEDLTPGGKLMFEYFGK